MSSLTGTLDAMRSFLPPALVSADAFERACAAVEHLQADITDGIYFECRLHDGSPGVDLVIIVREQDGALLASPIAGSPPGTRHDHPERNSLATFCRQWTAPGSSLHEVIEHIWLEYDVEPARSSNETNRPAPGVFCRLRRPQRSAHSLQELFRRTLTAVEALAGRTASRVVRECLFVTLARLPVEAAVPYVGLMTGRRVPTIRVCIAKLAAAGIGTYLDATAAVGGQEVAELVRRASLPDGAGGPLYVPMLHLDIDERHGFLSRIGMERPFAHICQLTGKTGAADRVLLDALLTGGLCTHDKRDALLTWPGRSVAMMPHELWWSVVERRVNHVKFVYEPGAGMEAKGYLFARYYRCPGPRPH